MSHPYESRDPNKLLDTLAETQLRDGALIRSEANPEQGYVLSNYKPGSSGTLTRAVPKLRGKPARKAEKAARRALRKNRNI